MAMGILSDYANNKIQLSRAAIDPIEVYLGLFIKLKEDLQLPFTMNGMLYFRCSNLSAQDLQEAKEAVLEQIEDSREGP